MESIRALRGAALDADFLTNRYEIGNDNALWGYPYLTTQDDFHFGPCSECVRGRLPLPEALRDEFGALILAPALQHLEV